MITLNGIGKTFRVMNRGEGTLPALKSLFHREYREVEALSSVSFHVDEGEIVGYIGPNGAGKSTSIKVMSGILVPDAGDCSVMGYVPWRDRREYVRHIGVVFGQRTQLWWDVPIMDSFALLRDIYKVPQAEYQRNLGLLSEVLALDELMGVPLRQLSLGQRMRAEIAGSLLHSPRVLFLDEPTIGLDAVSKLSVRKFIKQINEEKKLTVILTTHDMNDIEAVTDRILLIGRGRILRDGSMRQLRHELCNYRTLTVSFERHEQPVRLVGAELLSFGPERAQYRLDAGKVTVSEALGALSRELNITDMTSESRPIEEIIAQLYQEYRI